MGDIGRRQTRFEVLPVAGVDGAADPVAGRPDGQGTAADVATVTARAENRRHVGVRTEPARA